MAHKGLLLKALRERYRTPQDAIRALGLDEALLAEQQATQSHDHHRIAMDSKKESNMPSAQALRRAKIFRRLAMDENISPEDLAEILEATEGGKKEGEDNLDPNSAMPSGELDAMDRRVMDAMRKAGANDAMCRAALDAMRAGRDAYDEEEEARRDEEEERREEEEEAEDRRLRAADARKRLGRDETAEEMDRRERADDARRRLGRDESEEEREERERGEAEDRARRAEDARKRLGKDEVPDDVMKGELESARAADRRRHADDRRMRRAADRRVRADDNRRRMAADRRPRRTADSGPPAFKGRPDVGGKTAMDEAAVRRAADAAADAAVARERQNQRAIRDAERFVRPWVGELAMDEATSPVEVYRAALDHLGVKHQGLHPDALRPIIEHTPLPGSRHTPASRGSRVAMDAKPDGKGFRELFPETTGIRVI